LWEDFWRVVSILLETKDLQKAIDGKRVEETRNSVSSASPAVRPRSDSDIARELQAQFDAESQSARVPSQNITPNDIASMIQDISATAGNLGTPIGATPMTSIATQTSASVPAVEEELQADLYHYNGLALPNSSSNTSTRNAQLIKFKVTIQSRNLVGYSVPMIDTSKNGGHGYPIEDVLRTKWPSIKFNWNGQSPPSLD